MPEGREMSGKELVPAGMSEAEIRASREKVFGEELERVEGEIVEEKIYYSRILDDLDLITDFFPSEKGVTDSDELRKIKLKKARMEEAKDNLIEVGIGVNQFLGKREEARRNRNKLTIAVETIRLAQSGSTVDKDDLASAVKYLDQLGVDTSKVELPPQPIVVEERAEQEEQQTEQQPRVNRYARELEKRLKMAGGNPNAMRRAVENWMQKHADDADKIPPEVIARAQKVLTDIDEQMQKQRMAQRSGISAFGKTPEELAAMGVEERAQRKDPIIVELERPIKGHKIPFEYGMGMMPGMRMERRAYEADECFSGERARLLLAPIWSEALHMYNGEVTSETKADFSTLSTIESLLVTRIKEIGKTLNDARRGEAGKIFFASLVPGEKDLGLGGIYDQIVSSGFKTLSPEQMEKIPELRALHEMKQIFTWHEAQMQLLRTLQAMRSYSAGKKIDSIAALGDQPDRPLLPTSAIMRIWGLEQLENVPEGQPHEESRMVAKYTEDAKRIYKLIAAVAGEWPKFGPKGGVTFSFRDPGEAHLKRLIWEHLLQSELVESGGVYRNVKFVLNRFGQNLNPERLARVEAFVEHLVSTGVLDKYKEAMGGRKDWGELDSEVRTGLREKFMKLEEPARRGMVAPAIESEFEEEKPRDMEIELGCANAVATIHVTGLADRYAKFYEWTLFEPDKVAEKVAKARDRGKVVWTDREGAVEQPRVPMVKVGGYPACTAAAELMCWADKLEADRDIGLPIGPSTLEDAMRKKLIPTSLAKTFFEYTTINEAGVVVPLWSLWSDQGIPIYKLIHTMADKLPGNQHGGWLTSLKSSNKLRTLLVGTDPDAYNNMYKNDQLLGDIGSSLYFGLGPIFTDERRSLDDRIRGIVYAGLLVYNSGVSGQITSMEVNERLAKLRTTRGTSEEATYFLQKVIDDALAGKNAAVSNEGLRVMRELVEPYFVKKFGRKITQLSLTSVAFLVNQLSGGPGRNPVRYADIWNGKTPLPTGK